MLIDRDLHVDNSFGRVRMGKSQPTRSDSFGTSVKEIFNMSSGLLLDRFSRETVSTVFKEQHGKTVFVFFVSRVVISFFSLTTKIL